MSLGLRSRSGTGMIKKNKALPQATERGQSRPILKKLVKLLRHIPKNQVVNQEFREIASAIGVFEAFFRDVFDCQQDVNSGASASSNNPEDEEKIEKQQQELISLLKNFTITNSLIQTRVADSLFVKIGKYGPIHIPLDHEKKLFKLFNRSRVYFCHKCFKSYGTSVWLKNHVSKCSIDITSNMKRRIYSDMHAEIEVYVISGCNFKDYVINLMKFSSIFGDFEYKYKYLKYLDFFLMIDSSTRELVGFFSRDTEKEYVICVLMILPMFQRMGYGFFLVALAYGIAKLQKICRAPEEPYSFGGRRTIEKYWTYEIGNYLKSHGIHEGEGITETAILRKISRYTYIPTGVVKKFLEEKNIVVKDLIASNLEHRHKIKQLICDADEIYQKQKVRYYSQCVFENVLKDYRSTFAEPDQRDASKYGRRK